MSMLYSAMSSEGTHISCTEITSGALKEWLLHASLQRHCVDVSKDTVACISFTCEAKLANDPNEWNVPGHWKSNVFV